MSKLSYKQLKPKYSSKTIYAIYTDLMGESPMGKIEINQVPTHGNVEPLLIIQRNFPLTSA